MSAPTHVWIHNPATGGYWQCPAGLVDSYVEHRGWERCDPPAEDDSALYDAGDPRAQFVDEDPDDEDPESDPDEPGDPNHNTTEEQ